MSTVQMINMEVYGHVGDKYVGVALCALCGGEIGTLTRDEVNFLINVHKDDVICFECEQVKAYPFKPLQPSETRKLANIWKVDGYEGLPVHTCNTWYCGNLWSPDFIFQFLPMLGWVKWSTIDGELLLTNVKLSGLRASSEIKAARGKPASFTLSRSGGVLSLVLGREK